jgi:hypothetical protein
MQVLEGGFPEAISSRCISVLFRLALGVGAFNFDSRRAVLPAASRCRQKSEKQCETRETSGLSTNYRSRDSTQAAADDCQWGDER